MRMRKGIFLGALAVLTTLLGAPLAHASEAELALPNLRHVNFLGLDGHTLLLIGLGVCVLGLLFGLVMYVSVKRLPVHKAMREISELIYETCKTYLVTQGKFIMVLWVFIAAIAVIYFGWLRHFDATKVSIIVLFSLIGIA